MSQKTTARRERLLPARGRLICHLSHLYLYAAHTNEAGLSVPGAVATG
ncbi:MAG: hypothetical protein ACR2LZ_12400 [Pyrinomonadaceae bacterium]